MTNVVPGDAVYQFQAPTRALRDWLRGRPSLAAIVETRIFASVLPRGCVLPAIAFHRTGGGIDATLDRSMWQFDCCASNPGSDSPLGGPELAERIAAVLISLLVSTPARTRLADGVMFEGPATVTDSMYLPEYKTGVPRQIVRAALTLAGG